jgi:hypothetical protein
VAVDGNGRHWRQRVGALGVTRALALSLAGAGRALAQAAIYVAAVEMKGGTQ